MEIWKRIPKYKGYYVSSLGRIASARKHAGNPHGVRKICKPHISTVDGYARVSLYMGARNLVHKRTVHSLVLLAFKGKRKTRCSRHWDGNRTDNRLKNLSYGTYSQNNKDDRERHGTDIRGSKNPHARLVPKTVLAILKATGSQQSIAKKFGTTQSNVWRIKHGKRWGHLTGVLQCKSESKSSRMNSGLRLKHQQIRSVRRSKQG